MGGIHPQYSTRGETREGGEKEMEIMLRTLGAMVMWAGAFVMVLVLVVMVMEMLDLDYDERTIRKVLAADAALCIGLPVVVWMVSLPK